MGRIGGEAGSAVPALIEALKDPCCNRTTLFRTTWFAGPSLP